MRLPAFGGRDPVADRPRGIMPDMLRVATFQIGNPIQVLILMKADDFSGQTLALALRLHGKPIIRQLGVRRGYLSDFRRASRE
jgi:hypothetical protein